MEGRNIKRSIQSYLISSKVTISYDRLSGQGNWCLLSASYPWKLGCENHSVDISMVNEIQSTQYTGQARAPDYENYDLILCHIGNLSFLAQTIQVNLSKTLSKLTHQINNSTKI